MHILNGIERIEVSLRMQIGYILGRTSPFAHQPKSKFVSVFAEEFIDPLTDALTSRHAQWLHRVDTRQNDSDEAFVTRFRTKYDDQKPIEYFSFWGPSILRLGATVGGRDYCPWEPPVAFLRATQ